MNPTQWLTLWQPVRQGLVDTLAQFNEDELSHSAYAGGWSAGQIALHIADAEDGWFRYVVLGELQSWPEGYTLENFPTKGAIQGVLAAVHQRTEAYLSSLTPVDLSATVQAPWGASFSIEWVTWHVLEHEIHHRGELSLMLGMLGRPGLDV